MIEDRPSRALFAVSLSNERFSTEFVVPAIGGLLDAYDEIIFLIADKLQLYNSALRSFSEASDHSGGRIELFSSEDRLISTFNERRRWLNRVREQAGDSARRATWNILGIEDISDHQAFAIFRRVNILAAIDDKFRSDIRHASLEYAQRHPDHPERAAALSERYILEEIALSIRLRVVGEIFDEYYIGTSLKPIVSVYENNYLVSPWELAGLPQKSEKRFRFFDATEIPGHWKVAHG